MTNVGKNPAKSQPNGRFFYARLPAMPPTDGHCCEARRIIRRFVDGRNTEGFQSYLDAFQDVLFAYMDSELTEGLNTSDRQHNAMLLTAMNRLLYDVAHYLHRRE